MLVEEDAGFCIKFFALVAWRNIIWMTLGCEFDFSNAINSQA